MDEFTVIPQVASPDEAMLMLINRLLSENHYLREHPIVSATSTPLHDQFVKAFNQEQAANPTWDGDPRKLIEELKSTLHEREKRVQEATAIIRQRDNNIEELESGLFDQAQKLAGAEQRLQSAREELERLLKIVNPPPSNTNPLALTLKEQLDQHINLVSALREKNTEVEARCQSLHNERDNLQDANQELTKNCAFRAKRIQELDMENQELKGSPTHLAELQQKVEEWVRNTFGDWIMDDPMERCARFYEEASELIVAGGFPRETAVQLLHDAYARKVGQTYQKVGGVMITLAAFCANKRYSINLHDATFTELTRIKNNQDAIRAKHYSKPETLRPHTWADNNDVYVRTHGEEKRT